MSQTIAQASIKKYTLVLCGYVIISVISTIFGLSFGSERLIFSNIVSDLSNWHAQSIDSEILLYQRLPRVVMGLIAGGSLAMVGAVFQTILHNKLASPYTLGIAGCSSVGAVLAISVAPLASINIFGFGAVEICSMVGSGLAAVFIYKLARRTGGMSMNTLLLAGVAMGIVSSAMVMLIRYISSPHLLVSMDRWIMGGLDVSSPGEVFSLLPLIFTGVTIMLMQSLSLNHIIFGEELATGHGVSVVSVQKWCFAGGAITTAAVISQTGPIAFVGLIIPHLLKKLNGTDHRLLLPGCLLAGGAFLVICDTISRTIAAPAEMPVGIVTAAIGGVFFIYILCTRS